MSHCHVKVFTQNKGVARKNRTIWFKSKYLRTSWRSEGFINSSCGCLIPASWNLSSPELDGQDPSSPGALREHYRKFHLNLEHGAIQSLSPWSQFCWPSVKQPNNFPFIIQTNSGEEETWICAELCGVSSSGASPQMRARQNPGVGALQSSNMSRNEIIFPTFAALDQAAQLAWCGEREESFQTWVLSCRCQMKLWEVKSQEFYFTGCNGNALCPGQTFPITEKYLWNKWMLSLKTTEFGQSLKSHVVSLLCPWETEIFPRKFLQVTGNSTREPEESQTSLACFVFY